MTQYINKSTIVAEIKRRIKECNKLADAAADNNLSNTLQANELLIRQYTSLLHFLDTIEVKKMDLEKEVDSQMDLLCNLLCYMDELSNGDSEGVYPLPENVIEDLHRFAKHFYELGVKAQKGE